MLIKLCILFVIQRLAHINAEHPLLTGLKNKEFGNFGMIGFKDRLNGSLDYIENVLGHRVKFNESVHSFDNISYKYLTECDVKTPLNKFLFTTTNKYDHNTYRKRFFQQKSREDMFTKKYEAKYAKLRASSTKKITRFTEATNMFDSKNLMDNLLEYYPDMVHHLVSKVTWPRKLWTGTYPPDDIKQHPNNTTPVDWSMNILNTYSDEDYQGPERRLDPKDSLSAYGLSLAKEKVHYADEYNSQILPELERQWKIRGYFGNCKLSVDILLKGIIQNKRAGRVRRQALATTPAIVTDYAGKVDDPLSNCCNNSESREEFRRGVRFVKLKKYKKHFDAIKPPTQKTSTVKNEVEEVAQRAARVRRNDLDDLYPSARHSGDSHNIRQFGVDFEKQMNPGPSATRWPTTPKIINIPNPTKTKLIEDVEKRFNLKLEDLTTPYTLKWSPYGLVITNSEDIDSDSELEVMDWYEERESPTFSTKLQTPIFNFNTEPEPTLYDYDGKMTPFNIENIRKIEQKFNVSLKDLETHPDNAVIEASTFGYGLVGFHDLIKNISHEETMVDKMEPNLTPIFPTDWGFFLPNGQTVEYGARDWVLKDLLAVWKKKDNGSFETLHRQAENLTMEKKKEECKRLGILWTEPMKLTTRKHLMEDHTGSTFHPTDEAIMEDHERFVDYVNQYNEKHSLFPKKYTEETYNPKDMERQSTIMDWILRDFTDIRLEHAKRLAKENKQRPKRSISSIPPEMNNELDQSYHGFESNVVTSKDYYQTFDDPDDFAKALKSLQNSNNTIVGRDNFIKTFQKMHEEAEQETRHVNDSMSNINNGFTQKEEKRVRREMPYLGYSGLTTRIIFQWTNCPYRKTMAPYFLRRSRIQARHRPTFPDGARINIKRKQWTVHSTPEYKAPTLKFAHGIPVKESLDYGAILAMKPASPRKKRNVGEVTDLEDYAIEKNQTSEVECIFDSSVDGEKKGVKHDVAKINNNSSQECHSDVTTTEPPKTRLSSVKFHTVYARNRRAVDRFWDYVQDPVIKTVYGTETRTPTTLLPQYRPETSTLWGSETSWYHQTPREHEHTKGEGLRQKRYITQERIIPYIRANAYEERVTGHNFSYFMSMDAPISILDRLKRCLLKNPSNDLPKNPQALKVALESQVVQSQTDSWLKRFRREMPYLGYSGLTTRIIFQWTNCPYRKTMAPYFLRRSRIQARHRPTFPDGARINIKRKQWTVHSTPEYKAPTLKFAHGIPVKESLDYGAILAMKPASPREKRSVEGSEVDESATGTRKFSSTSTIVSVTNNASRPVLGSDGTPTSSTSNSSSISTLKSKMNTYLTNKAENGTSRVIGSTHNTTETSTTTQSAVSATVDNDSQTPVNIINPVQTLGRKKRSVNPQHKRRTGKDLFEKIIMAYYNCKNVWKEPHSPEILQIRRRYREQKNRHFNRIFGHRKHLHEDIYYE